jgi:hypothetical protein
MTRFLAGGVPLVVASVGIAIALSVVPYKAQAIPQQQDLSPNGGDVDLSFLIDNNGDSTGNTVKLGDKIFYGFDCFAQVTGAASASCATQDDLGNDIQMTFSRVAATNEYRWDVPLVLIANDVLVGNNFANVTWVSNVKTETGDPLINEVSLHWLAEATGTGVASIVEVVTDNDNGSDIAQLDVVNNPPADPDIEAIIPLPYLAADLKTSKDINVAVSVFPLDCTSPGGGGTCPTGFAKISRFGQDFRQVQVPEPATLGVLGVGLLGLGFAAHRRRKAT